MDDLDTPLAQVIRAHVLAVLERHDGNQKVAATALCISVPKLKSLLASYGIGTTADKVKQKTPAPEHLYCDMWESLSKWARLHEPWAVRNLERMATECLDYFRSKGELRADWVATCRTWVRNEVKRNPHLRAQAPVAPHKARPAAAEEKASPQAKAAMASLVGSLAGKKRMP